ncbi:MAG: cardiolipin synthase [Solobacterium sp.]|nr:cardiolipin synthase [Solobacterium sp.]
MVGLEAQVILGLVRWFGSVAAWIGAVLQVVSVLLVLYIIKNSRHLSSDMMWIILILLAPVPGAALWLFLAGNLFSSRTFRSLVKTTGSSRRYYRQDPDVLEKAEQASPELRGQFRYIAKDAGFPFYENTGFDYYGLGDEGYPVMLEELRKAKSFIFLEYFIIEEGEMWNGILEILEEKAKQGVDVRVLYDDLGSFFTLSAFYAKQLEEKGIRCVPFNRINPILGIIMNHRDHRKIMVIDGKVAFSGGVNLADEYINVKEKHGHWKDNIIRVTGEAVWSYTVMFLTHWNALRPTDDDFTKFRRDPESAGEPDGFIAPYGETPLDTEITGQNIYMSILNQANDYCYIFTPYLIIDTEFINALILAAKHGVDVKLITPGIPDKKIVWQITRSYYRQLMGGGVKIYEYTPGFIHSKVFVSDDRIATVGTVNLDYRSLYLHFENGTYLVNSKKVLDVRDDILETLKSCHQMNPEELKTNFFSELWLSLLRVFAPLM